MFAVFERDVRFILRKPDWLPRIIDIFGLLHHYHSDLDKPKFFALMEYTVAEVIEQARAKGIVHCIALPTVLEAQGNPAFCPVQYRARQRAAVAWTFEHLFQIPP